MSLSSDWRLVLSGHSGHQGTTDQVERL